MLHATLANESVNTVTAFWERLLAGTEQRGTACIATPRCHTAPAP